MAFFFSDVMVAVADDSLVVVVDRVLSVSRN